MTRGTLSAVAMLGPAEAGRRSSASAAIRPCRRLVAASWLSIPTVIHEQNAVIGRANRMLAARVNLIATGFPDVQLLDAR